MRIAEIAVSGSVGTTKMGPVSTVTCELSNNFAALGHQVTLLDVRCNASRALLHPSVKVIGMDGRGESDVEAGSSNPLAALVNRWRNYIGYVRRIARLPAVREADMIHVHAP